MRGGQLRFEQHIPKFLQGLVKPRPASRDSDDEDDERPTVAAAAHSASAAADAQIEDRPDRDDEAPVITNAEEYEKELENNLVDGVALPLPKVRREVRGAAAGRVAPICALS